MGSDKNAGIIRSRLMADVDLIAHVQSPAFHSSVSGAAGKM
jgi:hypothetical protein